MKPKFLWKSIVLVLLISPLLLTGQDDRTQGFARKATEELTIDGILNESIWRRTEESNHLIVAQPDRFTPEKVRTSVKVVFDSQHIYVGMVCLDAEPEKIKGSITIRDGDIRNDDSVYVLLDLFENIDNYYFFATNPLGAQTDGLVGKDGQLVNPEWNGDWEVGVQVTDEGWTAEFAINLTALQYEPIEGGSMGINVSRVVPRLDTSFWSDPMDPAFRTEDLVYTPRLAFALSEKLLQVIPYVMALNQTDGGVEVQGGVDVPFKFSQNVTSHVTVNPEFVSVEPDSEEFNLSRYELYLDERRDYLNDSEDLFGVEQEKLYYSKRQGDLYGGAKFNGTFGAFELSGMSNQQKKIEELDDKSANFSVVRINSRLGGRSSLGILAANQLLDGNNTGTAGVNGSLGVTEQFRIAGQFATSYGEYSDENLTFSVIPSYDTETFHFHLGYIHVGKNFGENVNAVGYVWDDNRREIDSALDKAFIVQKAGIEYLKYVSAYNIFWGNDGTLRSWEIVQGFSLLKQNRFEINVRRTEEYKLFEEEFRNSRTRIFLGLDTREWQLFNIILTLGDNFGQTFRLGEINKRFIVSRKFSFEFFLQFLTYPEIGGNRVDKQFLYQMLKATYDITQNLTFKGYLQYNEQIKKTNFQLFLFYCFHPPAGMIQFGLQKGNPLRGIVDDTPTTLFVKCSYAF
ncbi:carbohydrate binding family 9 domain-containing protein [Acidobacteriota bacterium]